MKYSFRSYLNFSKDVRLPVQLQRAMAAEAEAAREARAKVKKYHFTNKNLTNFSSNGPIVQRLMLSDPGFRRALCPIFCEISRVG